MRKIVLLVVGLLMVPFLTNAATQCPQLTRTLSLGMRGTDVSALQKFLTDTGFFSAGNTSGYFGSLTQTALKKFQCQQNIVCSGTPYTTGYGVVGAKTRIAIAHMCIVAPLPPIPTPVPFPTPATTSAPTPTPTLSPTTALDPRISVSHMSGIYPEIKTGDYLERGAADAISLGFQSIEILLHPSVCLPTTSLPYGVYQNLSWCNNTTYPTPDQTETWTDYHFIPSLNSSLTAAFDGNIHYQNVFNLPFKTIFLTVDGIDYANPDPSKRPVYVVSGTFATRRLTTQELDNTYAEFFAFTSYLLHKYANSQKTIILQTPNEMDWQIIDRANDPNNASTIGIANAIDYWNTIQRAVDTAKAATPAVGLRVYHACEINLVTDAISGRKHAVTEVLPHTHCDLYGYSAYDSILPDSIPPNFNVTEFLASSKLQAALDFIAQNAPDSADFASRNVFISEMGFQEQYLRVAGNYIGGQLAQYFMGVAFNWGVPYINLWTLYDNECDTYVPTSSQCRGYWMRKPNGDVSDLYKKVTSMYSGHPDVSAMYNQVFMVGNQIMSENNVGEVCTYFDWESFKALSGLSSTAGLKNISAIPTGAKHVGACLMLNRIFQVPAYGILFQSADGSICSFQDFESFKRITGRSNYDGIPTLGTLPPGTATVKACQ